jgi:hypothetical protein
MDMVTGGVICTEALRAVTDKQTQEQVKTLAQKMLNERMELGPEATTTTTATEEATHNGIF